MLCSPSCCSVDIVATGNCSRHRHASDPAEPRVEAETSLEPHDSGCCLNKGTNTNTATASLPWTLETTSSAVRDAEYAVRGRMAIRAEEILSTLNKQEKEKNTLDFDEVVCCNIGNPQQLGQKPITFLRQLMALVEYPDLMRGDARRALEASRLFPPDAYARAESLLDSIHSVGAYSHSKGISSIRNNVARFISERDGGIETNPEHIFLTSGASSAVSHVLQCLIDAPDVGILVPVPQYPLYTATIAMLRGRAVPYLLDEGAAWGCDVDDIRRAISEARAQGTRVRAICVINPGNPTGGVLSVDTMRQIIALAHQENLVLLADEVYQANVHTETTRWVSFRQVLAQHFSSSSSSSSLSRVQIASFHSVSKGVFGECGRRGGYVELHNVPDDVVEQVYKLASISLCPSVGGQIAVDVMVRPPRPGEPSHELFKSETDAIAMSLRQRAETICTALNKLTGVSCVEAAGAMYLFPRIRLPAGAVAAAAQAGIAPDAFYTLALLEKTGICSVPGSGFLQAPGTFHFRLTFLPPRDKIDAFLARMTSFHEEFIKKYS